MSGQESQPFAVRMTDFLWKVAVSHRQFERQFRKGRFRSVYWNVEQALIFYAKVIKGNHDFLPLFLTPENWEKYIINQAHLHHVMADQDSSARQYLAENPRMLGVLFTAVLLLTQAGNVLAANGGTTAGP